MDMPNRYFSPAKGQTFLGVDPYKTVSANMILAKKNNEIWTLDCGEIAFRMVRIRRGGGGVAQMPMPMPMSAQMPLRSAFRIVLILPIRGLPLP